MRAVYGFVCGRHFFFFWPQTQKSSTTQPKTGDHIQNRHHTRERGKKRRPHAKTVVKAILSFPRSSGPGPSGKRPSHRSSNWPCFRVCRYSLNLLNLGCQLPPFRKRTIGGLTTVGRSQPMPRGDGPTSEDAHGGQGGNKAGAAARRRGIGAFF